MKSVLLALLVCAPTLVFAQPGTGSELRNSGTDFVKVCGAAAQGQPSQYAAACNIWLTGVMDGLQAYNANLKSLPLFDAPQVDLGQVARQLVNYITSHPQQAQLPTAALVLGTLVENYPRKEGTPTPPTPAPTPKKP